MKITQILKITNNMIKLNVPYKLALSMITPAMNYNGIFQLMLMWEETECQNEKDEIINDIKKGLQYINHKN